MMDDPTITLQACIVSHKGGIPAEDLDEQYFKFTGEYIPYLRMGYNSLYEFLGTLKNLTKERNSHGQWVYKVFTPSTAHIASLVANQKDSISNRYTKRNMCSNVRTRNREPNRENISWRNKRKALNQGRSTRKINKRQKSEWGNNYFNRSTSSGEAENRGDFPSEFCDYENWYADEVTHPVRIFDEPQRNDVVFEPIINGKLLIGDDFFLQLAIRNLGSNIWRKGPNTALHSGLCVSGQTIRECTQRLRTVEALSSKVVVMLGAEDIYQNFTADDMIQDMEELLELLEVKFDISKSAITICTIPPLANLAPNCHPQQLAALEIFNSWIRGLCYTSATYKFIDFFTQNTNVQDRIAYEYFQMDARMVSGTPHPYVLWNVRGRRIAMNLLRSGDT